MAYKKPKNPLLLHPPAYLDFDVYKLEAIMIGGVAVRCGCVVTHHDPKKFLARCAMHKQHMVSSPYDGENTWESTEDEPQEAEC